MPLTAEAFFDKAMPEPMTGCFLWTGAHTGHGYGQVWTGSKNERAHRVAWKLVYGDIPSGIEVCHRCDVPSCVNPAHLFLGTHQRNMRDSFNKGRSRPADGTATQFKPQTYCKRGHPKGAGECRVCKSARDAQRDYGLEKRVRAALAPEKPDA